MPNPFSRLSKRRPSPVRVDEVHDGVWVRTIDVAGDEFVVGDSEGSNAVDIIATEIGVGPYDFSSIPFEDGDVVVDIGAHVGMVSMWLARRHPGIQVYAFEPIPETYARLVENLERNGITNVKPHNLAVTSDGRDLDMVIWSELNSGGGTASFSYRDPEDAQHHRRVPSTTIDRIFEDNEIAHCRLLKIDIEGGEHEVLLTAGILDRIEYVRGEFHENTHLRGQGYSMKRLEDHVSAVVGRDRVEYTPCEMAEL